VDFIPSLFQTMFFCEFNRGNNVLANCPAITEKAGPKTAQNFDSNSYVIAMLRLAFKFCGDI